MTSLIAIIHYGTCISLIFFGLLVRLSVEVSIKENQRFCYEAQGKECLESKGLGRTYSSWPALCSKGHDQSPIDVPKLHTVASAVEIKLDMESYNEKDFFIVNNGNTIKIYPVDHVAEARPISPKSKGRKAGDINESALNNKHTYVFAQAHFHWGPNNSVGSEHKIGHERFSLEMHLVHYSSLYGDMKHAASSKDHAALSVIGSVFQASDSNPDNPLFKVINEHFPLKEDGSKTPIQLNLHEFLPKKGATFYRYLGSLTTPDCEEIVLWNLFDQPIPISTKDMEKFRLAKDSKDHLMSENYREVQNTYSRTIEYHKLL